MCVKWSFVSLCRNNFWYLDGAAKCGGSGDGKEKKNIVAAARLVKSEKSFVYTQKRFLKNGIFFPFISVFLHATTKTLLNPPLNINIKKNESDREREKNKAVRQESKAIRLVLHIFSRSSTVLCLWVWFFSSVSHGNLCRKISQIYVYRRRRRWRWYDVKSNYRRWCIDFSMEKKYRTEWL